MKRLQLLFGLCLLIALQACDENNSGTVSPEVNGDNFTSEARGCSDFYVYRFNDDNTLLCSISGDGQMMGISDTVQTFTIDQVNLQAEIREFNGDGTNFPCDDVANDEPSTANIWQATQGTVTVRTEPYSIDDPDDHLYKIFVVGTDIEFMDGNNDIITIEEITFTDIIVGWFPG